MYSESLFKIIHTEPETNCAAHTLDSIQFFFFVHPMEDPEWNDRRMPWQGEKKKWNQCEFELIRLWSNFALPFPFQSHWITSASTFFSRTIPFQVLLFDRKSQFVRMNAVARRNLGAFGSRSATIIMMQRHDHQNTPFEPIQHVSACENIQRNNFPQNWRRCKTRSAPTSTANAIFIW